MGLRLPLLPLQHCLQCNNDSTNPDDAGADHIIGGAVDVFTIRKDTAEKNRGDIVWDDAKSLTATLPDGNFEGA